MEDKNRIKAGVEEKKKTQGMRRDSAHFCGTSPLLLIHSFGCFFLLLWAKIGQLNKPDIENTFVYAYLLVNFFAVRKNDIGTNHSPFKILTVCPNPS